MSGWIYQTSPKTFLGLLKLSIASFILMGILIGYHGSALVNSFIGAIWFGFVMTASLVLMSAMSSKAVFSAKPPKRSTEDVATGQAMGLHLVSKRTDKQLANSMHDKQ